MSEVAPSRRSVLAGMVTVGMLTVSGCTTSAPTPPPEPRPDPDVAVRAAVSGSVGRLAAAYEVTAQRHPSLRGRLAPLAAEHQVHLAALGAATANASPANPSAANPSSANPSAAPSGSPPGSADPSLATTLPAPAVPLSPAAALVALAGAERANADQRVRDLATASPRLARLVASIGAAEAAHAALLGGPG